MIYFSFNVSFLFLIFCFDRRMANFKGHALPGSCFLLLGLCWSMKYPLRHCWRRRQPKGRQKLPLFFNRIDLIEGALIIFLAFVGECLPWCTYLYHSLFQDFTLWNLSTTFDRDIVLSFCRHHGRAVCARWAPWPPVPQRD